jgi:hypothetical protein
LFAVEGFFCNVNCPGEIETGMLLVLLSNALAAKGL